MIGRREFLWLFGLAALGVSLPPAAAGVVAATPTDSIPAFRIPRGVVVTVPAGPIERVPHVPSIMDVMMISTGDRLVPLESYEGQRIHAEGKPSMVKRHFIRSTE